MELIEGAGNQLISGSRSAVTYYNRKSCLGKDLDDNYNSLKEVAEKLDAKRNDIKNAEKRDKTNQSNDVRKNWISRVDNRVEEAKQLETEYTTKYAEQRGHFFDPVIHPHRIKLSRRMAKKCEELNKFYLEMSDLVEKPPPGVIPMSAAKIEDKPLLQQAVKDILGHLRKANVRRVGLLGTVGVGKTAIMTNVHNNAEIAEMFDFVIWLALSDDWSIKDLQLEIMERLKMNTEGITEPIAQRQLSRALGSNSHLLLLDSVWKDFDLKEIGISNQQINNKVVLATTSPRICNVMETDEEVRVQKLSNNDAYNMFLEQLGAIRESVHFSCIEPIAIKVAQECCCFPVLLEKVAIAFKRYNDDPDKWKAGLRKLQRWPDANTIVPGIDELIGALEFCYNELRDKDQKACFLYCALYPEDFEIYIDHLLECWKAEDFIHADRLIDAREDGQLILHNLNHLLERSEKMYHVRMNKLVWRMAHKISKESDLFKMWVKRGEEAPDEEERRQVRGVSLMDNKLCTLREIPGCSSLSTLFLQRSRSLQEILESFFKRVTKLRVLDLHDTRITCLPSSVSYLTCLKALYLNSCVNLKDLPTGIKKLECLEILDIRGTKINFLPNQIQGMTQLKCLRFSLSDVGMGQSRVAKLDKGVLSSLSSLEELRIDVKKDIKQSATVIKAIAKQVADLKCLTSLSIHFPVVDYLEKFISTFTLWEDLDFRFQFSVGSHDQTRYKIFDNSKYQMRRCLKFANGEGVNLAISKVLAKSNAFELVGHKGASKLSNFGVENFQLMRGCLIEGCNEIVTLIENNGMMNDALKLLEEMHINDAANLTSIWEGVFHRGSLGHLKTLTLCKCRSLKKIFSNGMIAQLSKLQNLKVEECPEIEEIIMESENRGLEPDVIPSLKTLVLLDLPEVRSICINDSIKWSSLKKIEISMCPLLTKLPFNNENAINLKCIEVQQAWWNALEWQEEAIGERLRSKCSFN